MRKSRVVSAPAPGPWRARAGRVRARLDASTMTTIPHWVFDSSQCDERPVFEGYPENAETRPAAVLAGAGFRGAEKRYWTTV